MKKYFFHIALVATVAISATGCKKSLLTPVPTTSISDLSAFSSASRIEGQVRSMYAVSKNNGMFGGRYQIFNDIRGGDYANNRTNVVTGYDVWSYTPGNSSSNSVEAFWGRAYLVINLANVFIDGMAAGGTTVVGDALSKNYVGEARFMRALCYYGLLQFYARPYGDGNGAKPGVPLRLTGNTGSGDYALARATVAQVYQQILDDLNFAETNLPLTYSSAALNTTRAHRNTAIALKTRVYLSMRNYPSVITEANKIVTPVAPFTATTGVPHALQADIANVFKTPYTTTESILSMPFNSTETPGTQNQLGYYYGAAAVNGGNDEYTLLPTGIISNPGWTAVDKRKTNFTLVSGTRTYMNKFPGGGQFLDWAPVVRYAEVLLNLAEARVRSTNTVDPQAVALLNAIRGRSDATTVFTVASFADAAALADAILIERRIELMGEGFGGADLTRLGLTLPAKPGVNAIPATGQQYIWPIPASELLLNTAMTDN